MRLAPLLLPLLAGCAMTSSTSPTSERQTLDRELAALVPGEAQDCISVPLGPGSLNAVDSQTIVYRQGRTTWVNRLPAQCPGLRPNTTLVIQVHGGRYCRRDQVQALEPGDVAPGPVCFLGQFTPYRPADSGS